MSAALSKYAVGLILLAGLLVRLYQIDAPLVGTHNWRQCDTAGIARNYHQEGLSFAYPRVDWRGDTPGYVESEFPIYPFAVALLYRVLGPREYLGRLLATFCFLGAAWFLYLLVKDLIDRRTALWACFLYTFLPLNLFYSRSFQPEAVLLLGTAAGVCFFYRWLNGGNGFDYLLSAAFVCLALLVKIPNLVLGLPLLYLAWCRYGRRTPLKAGLWLYAGLVLLPVAWWYFHAHQLWQLTGLSFGFWPGQGGPWSHWQMVFSLGYWNRVLFQHLAEHHFLWPGFALFIWGLFRKTASRQERVLHWWLAAFAVYLAMLPERNFHHEYYQLPIMLPGVVLMAKPLAAHLSWPRRRSWQAPVLALLVLAVLAGSGQRYLRHLAKEDPPRSFPPYHLVQALKTHSRPGDLIVTAWGHSPAVLYHARRKGWTTQESALSVAYLKDKAPRGAALLAAPPGLLTRAPAALKAYLRSNGKVLWDSPQGFLWRFKPAPPGQPKTSQH